MGLAEDARNMYANKAGEKAGMLPLEESFDGENIVEKTLECMIDALRSLVKLGNAIDPMESLLPGFSINEAAAARDVAEIGENVKSLSNFNAKLKQLEQVSFGQNEINDYFDRIGNYVKIANSIMRKIANGNTNEFSKEFASLYGKIRVLIKSICNELRIKAKGIEIEPILDYEGKNMA